MRYCFFIFLIFIEISSICVGFLPINRLRLKQLQAYDDDLESDYIQQNYIPAFGMESMLYTLGNTRSMSSMEYDIVFQNYPGLRNATLYSEWPERFMSDFEKDIIRTSLDYSLMNVTEELLMEKLNFFRQNLNEKYGQPIQCARQYSDFIRLSLKVLNGWKLTYNLLKQQHLIIKNEVTETFDEEINSVIPILNVSSLWINSIDRLLSMNSSTDISTKRDLNDSDMRNQLKNEKNYDSDVIMDMMCGILVTAAYSLLDDNNIKVININYTPEPSLQRQGFLPSSSTVRTILSSRFNIVNEDSQMIESPFYYFAEQINFFVTKKTK